ncbi:D-erythrose 4-phosphate dehydrogenase [Allopseudospirillum japonicum]|uniref:D-erythrose 4-phosphate dehydrogenase n=1 Tax=Allopseudospirillum japonicum TaxID=64971 RepID=A0A1H6R199_9GAMM|nr:glyceraldehyde 3-phosphate dehydrogenase NAD-binding domain-containing protein [Allopseudospirillum japonicum]SEI45335.1 D-erythrose 4-phosphate dehydrogenase [Allopseudospirillum japonicum]
MGSSPQTYRIAINGYGRIGQCVLRACYERRDAQALQIVALNELSDSETIAYLTRYDTTHGRFPGQVRHEAQRLLIDDYPIMLLNHAQPKDLPWDDLGIDLVLECSGSFKDKATAQVHLEAGARRLLFSQPAEPNVDATIVYGVNHRELRSQHTVVSAASCTTNCVVPILKLLDEHLGIAYGTTTTIHSAMNDQPVIDAYHQTDLRLTRSAMHSIIPVDTGLPRGIERLLPHLKDRIQSLHVRVPTINVSALDLVIQVQQATCAQEINALLKAASENELAGIAGYSEEVHASVDFNHDPRSVIIDATQTRVAGSHLVKLWCWFDNEWGFANRMLDVALHWLQLDQNTD